VAWRGFGVSVSRGSYKLPPTQIHTHKHWYIQVNLVIPFTILFLKKNILFIYQIDSSCFFSEIINYIIIKWILVLNCGQQSLLNCQKRQIWKSILGLGVITWRACRRVHFFIKRSSIQIHVVFDGL